MVSGGRARFVWVLTAFRGADIGSDESFHTRFDMIYPAVGLLATQLTEQAVTMSRIKLITAQDNYGRQ